MKSKIGLLIAQCLLLLLINESNSFNLDVNNYIRHEGQDGSMFGFSVALHQEQQRSWWVSQWSEWTFRAISIRCKLHSEAEQTGRESSKITQFWILRWRYLETHFLRKRLAVSNREKKKKIIFELIRSWFSAQKKLMMSSQDFFHRSTSATRWEKSSHRLRRNLLCSSGFKDFFRVFEKTNNKNIM